MIMNCIVCDSTMHIGLDFWHWKCSQCGYETATLESGINVLKKHLLIDEIAREEGLKPLREHNFRKLIQLIFDFRSNSGQKLLDVGAAHGWFIKMASEHFDVLGIEPDHNIYKKALKYNLPLIEGYFPDALSRNQKFDVIVFNDVFEHIHNVEHTLEACRNHLQEDGLLILNLPSSDGFFYKLSKILKRLKSPGSFNRLWQRGMPSPHLHYFCKTNLTRFVEKNRFKKVFVGEFPSVQTKGLYHRIVFDNRKSKLTGAFSYLLILFIIPFLKLFKSDIAVLIFKKNQETS